MYKSGGSNLTENNLVNDAGRELISEIEIIEHKIEVESEVNNVNVELPIQENGNRKLPIKIKVKVKLPIKIM